MLGLVRRERYDRLKQKYDALLVERRERELLITALEKENSRLRKQLDAKPLEETRQS